MHLTLQISFSLNLNEKEQQFSSREIFRMHPPTLINFERVLHTFYVQFDNAGAIRKKNTKIY